jgi:predicted ATP-grasp superfamily ATP-dependent carboligase
MFSGESMARLSQAAPVPAVVVNANNISALIPIRSLGRKGVPIVAVFGQGSLARYAPVVRSSRFISDTHTFDDSDYERSLVSCLRDIGKSHGRKSVLFPTSDEDMIIVSAHRDALQEYYHLLMPSHELLSILLNKHCFYPFAEARGIPIPRTFRIDSLADIEHIARKVAYPCIIKPAWRNEAWQTRFGNRKVIISNGPEELRANFRSLDDQFKGLTVQEVVHGDESNIVCSFTFLDERSEPLGIFISKKIRQFPPHFGNSSLVQRVSEPKVLELTTKVCKQLGLVGYVSIEFKKDDRDGAFKVIEVTPCRVNRQTGLSDEAGLSIPYIWYRQVLNMPVESALTTSECTWVSEVNEVRAFLEYWRSGEYTVSEWLRSYKNVTCFEVLAKDDPLPIIVLLLSAFLHGVRSTVLREAPVPAIRAAKMAGHEDAAARQRGP